MRLVCIVGPTASGKSALALDLAERLGAEIVSADSRQIYRDLDIGTAKPTAAERARVRHHCLDLVASDEAFDAARFRDVARAAIADIERRGRAALVVGGTGLYVRALLGGLCPAPPRAPALRAMLEAGFLDEVRALRRRGLGTAAPGLPAVGYRELLACVEGRTDLETALAAMVRATRQFGKRQRTWFRREPAIVWHHPEREAGTIAVAVEAFLAGAAPAVRAPA